MHEIVIMYLCFNFAICEHILLGPTPSKRKCRQHTDFEKKSPTNASTTGDEWDISGDDIANSICPLTIVHFQHKARFAV